MFSTCDSETRMSSTWSSHFITRFSSAWFMIDMIIKVKRETETFVTFIGVCALQCVLDVSQQPAQAEACWLSQPPEELWTRNASFGALPKIIS